jgi:hypothetical protein
MQLAALEYVVIKGDWDARQVLPQSAVGVREIPVPPMLFGQEFKLHQCSQPVRPAAVLLTGRLDLEGQPCRHLRYVEPHRSVLRVILVPAIQTSINAARSR